MNAKRLLATRFLIAGMAVILAGVPELAKAAQEPAPADVTAPGDQNKAADTTAQEPDSPGATKAQEQQTAPAADGTAAVAGQSATPSQSQTPSKKPLGTAAAQPLTPSGTAGSEPAGVAIAPAKQRRTRSLLIKVGAILAAGAAVGTVYALSSATGSKPPGSR